MEQLNRTQFGNPILRAQATKLSLTKIRSNEVKTLIKAMYHTLDTKKYGVGLAAPQVGHSLALAVIATKPTPTRPSIIPESLTLINPTILKTFGRPEGMWEGCISGPNMYALTQRYKKIQLQWLDEKAVPHEATFDGLLAEIIQHEVDHLNGVLFVDKVHDTKSYMTFSEYRKMQRRNRTKH